jgi:hypothetical protein
LVVLDEIDGALGGANDGSLIKFLCDLVQSEGVKQHAKNADAPEESEQTGGLADNDPQRKRRKGAKISRRTLMRPIICICNDLYGLLRDH